MNTRSRIMMPQRYQASANLLSQLGLSLSSLFFLSVYLPIQAASASPFTAGISTASPIEARSLCDIFLNRQEAQAFFEHNSTNAINLNPDGDGQACRHLSTTVRTDGYQVSSGSTSNGWRFEVWKSSVRSSYGSSHNQLIYYVKAWRSSQSDTLLTTRSFSSAQAAYEYFVNSLS